jgi:hypothetical protein
MQGVFLYRLIAMFSKITNLIVAVTSQKWGRFLTA